MMCECIWPTQLPKRQKLKEMLTNEYSRDVYVLDYLATLITRTELTNRKEVIDIVRANEILGHADDGLCERRFTVVIRGVLCNVSGKLGDFDFLLEVSFEAGEEDFSLAGLESVANAWDGSNVVGNGEIDEFFMDEVFIGECLLGVVDVFFWIEFDEPFLSVFRSLLIESEIDAIVVFLVVVAEFNRVAVHAVKVFLRFLIGRRTETFVVFRGPEMRVRAAFSPSSEVGDREERESLRALLDFHDGRDELFEEAGHLVETWPEGLNEVDEETLDVRAVVILIGHDHDRTVPQTLYVLVGCAQSHAHYFDNVLDFYVFRDLLRGRISHV